MKFLDNQIQLFQSQKLESEFIAWKVARLLERFRKRVGKEIEKKSNLPLSSHTNAEEGSWPQLEALSIVPSKRVQLISEVVRDRAEDFGDTVARSRALM